MKDASNPTSTDPTPYRRLDTDLVAVVEADGTEFLRVSPQALTLLAREAMRDAAFLLRPGHLEQLAVVATASDASDNDRYVARALLDNAVEAARGILPMCQDTGTAIVVGQKGERVWTRSDDAQFLAQGIREAYARENLRYSQMAPLSMFEEVNTGDNLPAQIDLYSVTGMEYRFLFLAKGGGSANKTFLFQETAALLNEERFLSFWKEKLLLLGTTACPPYHIAIVVGGTSAEANLKIAKLASAGACDDLPTSGNVNGRSFRDLEWEERILELCRESGIGAQFGGRSLAHDVRVIRLPRHAASNPVSLAVSCSAHRNVKAKITREGIFLERLESNPARFIPTTALVKRDPVAIDCDRPMPEILAELGRHPVGTLLHLSGTLIVARDLAHARLAAMVRAGQTLPDYFKQHPVYYAGPAKTPEGMATGSFGPTTAGRMDAYVDLFQSMGGSLVMIAKGNRTPQVTQACRTHGGFYLGSIGGPAATLARHCITSVETVDFADLGMEAVRRIMVRNFPAFILVDDKGHDLFQQFGYDR